MWSGPAYTNNLVIDNINIDGIDNNTAILIANETGAVIQNCKINGIRTLSNSAGIYSETVIDSELNRSNSLKISNCIFNNLFLPIIIKGKTSKNEEFVIENCFGNNTIKISNASFITITDCICKIENNNEIIGNVVMLDNIKDPGNLGTIIRSALAFNYQTIILSKECVDVYNGKVIRSSEGMLFNINIIIDDIEKYIYGLFKY